MAKDNCPDGKYESYETEVGSDLLEIAGEIHTKGVYP